MGPPFADGRPPVKTRRQIAIADHLWEAFERMAEEMGSERDALVNQAMHVFARLNGFIVPNAPPEDPDEPPPPLPRSEVAERVLEAAERLEKDIHEPTPVDLEVEGARGLLIMREDGTPLE